MKIPSNIKSAAKLLLTLILDNAGGHSEVARLADTDRQLLFAACERGFISLRTVAKVSKALKISPWALSYVKLYEIFGEDSKFFEDVVCDPDTDKYLNDSDVEKIIKVYRKK